DPQVAIRHGRDMADAGATIIDVGGESTRPGAEAVSAREQLYRVLPVIRALRGQTKALISIDTSDPEVMTAACDAGADIINDVRALQQPGALETAARTGAGVCLMHMQGTPQTMQDDPQYDDVVQEVRGFLSERVQACRDAGIAVEKI